MNFCSGAIVRRKAREYDHGLRCEEIDGVPQERSGFGDYPGQDDGGASRGGSVCLNSLLGPDKWKTAFVMLPAGLPSAY